MADATPSRRKRLSDGGVRVSFSQELVVEEPAPYREEEVERSAASSDSDTMSQRTDASQSQRSPRKSRRRKVVHWTREEEQCLIRGVKKHGLGRWLDILEDGHGVFHEHRTNVDLKARLPIWLGDKWKNLVKKIPQTEEEERAADTRVWRQVVATRFVEEMLPSLSQHGSDAGSETEDEGSQSSQRARRASSESRRQSTGEPSDPHKVRLHVATDATAPHMRKITVSTVDYPTVTALKRLLARQLLEDSPLPTNLQLIGIHSRRLLGDLESVEDCIQRDGQDLYLLHDP